ncbi:MULTISPECIES: MMPL family transporter [Exiguobacterium]|uniref:MMPL family transporter n=1 Tax=Exiguobacterium antarcticum TaxID=132920 RepID=A0ABT6R276_9BACL|nr:MULTISPECIES: MMPL family transporter [Exiguobacterium]MCT4779239.1 MMPL family transporter [Exiguobacterium soli]MDI3235052.1 MMPL family transporter [Exiguobacterium antarcticum]
MERFGRQVVRFRKSISVIWLIVLIGLGYFAVQLPDQLKGNGFTRDGEFQQVERVLEREFNQDPHQIIVLFEGEENTIREDMDRHVAMFRTIQGVGQVVGLKENPDALKDGKGYVSIGIPNIEPSWVSAVQEKLDPRNGSSIRLTGEPLIVDDLNTASKNDLVRAELIGVPAALLVLLVVFGTPLAAILPLIMGLVTFIFGAGTLYFIAGQQELSIFVLNAVAMISLALGIDFSLLYVNRFREERAGGRSITTSAEVSVATAGRSILFSGICVFVGLAGLLVIDVDVFQAVAIGTLVSVLGAVVSAVTLLPALLALLGKWLEKGRIFKTDSEQGEVRWRKLARFVMKRPVAITLFSLLLLLPCLIPLRDLELNIPQASALPEDYESRLAFEAWEKTFGNDGTDAVVLLKADFQTEQGLEQLEALTTRLEADEGVRGVVSAASLAEASGLDVSQIVASDQGKQQLASLITFDSGVARVNVNLTGDPGDKTSQAWVREIREQGYQVGGPAAFNQEIYDEIYSKMPLALGIVLLATFIILLIAFQSILIPIKAILMNLLSLGATFGLLVIIFESGLVFPAETIGILTPVFIFSLVFGLSMDYEVFLVSRMEEYYEETGDNDLATEMGLAKTSKIITSAALIMIVVTGAFAFTGVSPIKQLGVGIALAIFIDATIVRMFLVPALMKLFGHWNWWWPGGRRKRKHRIG